MLVAATYVFVACEDVGPGAPAKTPETVEEFFGTLERAIQQDGKVFHATVEIRARENGVEGLWGDYRGLGSGRC